MAADEHGEGASTEHWRGIGLRVGAHRVVVPLAAVSEVRPLPALARVPGAPPWLLGVGNANGRLLPVTDLGLYAGLEARAGAAARVVVVEREGHLTGIAVDEVSGVANYACDDAGDAGAVETPDGPALPARLAGCLGAHASSPGEPGERRRILDLDALMTQPAFVAPGSAA